MNKTDCKQGTIIINGTSNFFGVNQTDRNININDDKTDKILVHVNDGLTVNTAVTEDETPERKDVSPMANKRAYLISPLFFSLQNNNLNLPKDVPEAIERLRARSVVHVESASSSSTISEAFINISPCFENQTFPRTLQAILLGQIMSICLCVTGIASQALANRGFNAPAAQNFLNYFFLAFVYGTAVFARRGSQKTFGRVIELRGWRYVLLALIDVEANYLIVYAYQFTNLTSIQLLNCFTIPVVLLLSWLFLAVRYSPTHITGVAVCLLGVAIVIVNDAYFGRALDGGQNKILGDVLSLAATLLYGTSNVCEEFLIKQNDRSEYLGMIGLFGFIITGIQLAAFESSSLALFSWTSSSIIGYLLFTASMFFFYSLVSVVMQRTSALMFNLSVLTASFYSLLASVFLFQNAFHLSYFISFAAVLVGSTVYSARETRTVQREDRECLFRLVDCCCPWSTLCCGDCGPQKNPFTVQDIKADKSISSAADIRSEIHSSFTSSS